MFGIGVYQYVQLARLKRASYRLAFRDDAITEIALDSGYEGPEFLSRAFRQRIGQTPGEFRKQPRWIRWRPTYRPITETRTLHMKPNMQQEEVSIIDFKETRVAFLEHRGDPTLIGDSIRKFINWRKEAGLPPRTSATFNILYDAPTETRPKKFRLDLCAASERDVAPNDVGVVPKARPGGRCAVLRYIGSDDCLVDEVHHL